MIKYGSLFCFFCT